MSNSEHPQSLRIFTIISQIEQLLEAAPRPKLAAGGRRLVDVDEVFDLLGDLKVTIPEDIRRANSVLIEADTLLDHANQDAMDLVDQAQQEADRLHEQATAELMQTRQAAEVEFEARVAQDSVLVEVQRRCELLQQHAQYNANVVYNGAKDYADAILQDLQRYLMEYHQMVGKNRSDLDATSTRPAAPAAAPPKAPVYDAPRAPVAPTVAAPAAPARPRPVEPQAPSVKSFLENPEEEPLEDTPMPRSKRGWFQKEEQDGALPEDAPGEEDFGEEDFAQAPPRRFSFKRRARTEQDELDLDLPE